MNRFFSLATLIAVISVFLAGCGEFTVPATDERKVTFHSPVNIETVASATPAAPAVRMVREYPEIDPEDGCTYLVHAMSDGTFPKKMVDCSNPQPAPKPATPVTSVGVKPAASCSAINPSPFVGGNWTFASGNMWSLMGGSQEIHGAQGWVVQTPGYPDGSGLPTGKLETTNVATAYDVGGCQ